MRKGEIAITLILLIVGLIVVSYLFNKGQLDSLKLGAVTGGVSTLSVSQPVSFRQADGSLTSGDYWLLLLSVNQGGQFLEGTFTDTALRDGNKVTKSAFELHINMRDNRIEYPIRNDYQSFYYVDYENMGAVFNPLQTCQNRGGYFIATAPGLNFDMLCFKKHQTGIKGTILEGNEIFSADAIVKRLSDGQTLTSVINNVDATSIRLGNDLALIQWQGSLVTGQERPSAASQGICALWVNGWKTIGCNEFSSWSIEASGFQSCVGSNPMSYDAINNCVQKVNNAFNSVDTEKKITASGGLSSYTTGASVGSGKVVLELDKQFGRYSFPVLTAKISASWLGVVVQSGQPKVISSSCEKFKTGTNGYIKATISNVGSAQGSFDVSATCSSPFSSNDRQRVVLQPNQQSDVFMIVNGQSQQGTISGLCTVRAQDFNEPLRFDEKSVQCSIDTICVCQVGSKQALGKIIQECDQVTCAWKTIKTCGDNEYADPLSYECKPASPGVTNPPPGDDNKEECEWWNIPCQLAKTAKGIADFIIGLGIIIVLIIVGLIAFNLTKK